MISEDLSLSFDSTGDVDIKMNIVMNLAILTTMQI